MLLIERFKDFFIQHKLASTGSKFLLAVSGGVDSVVLCELSRQAGLNFSIAHCNFQLRGSESERDEVFVKGLGSKYDVDVIVKKFDTASYAEQNKISIQEAARNLRYSWFAELRTEQNFLVTLLAHHADDNIETLLMNFFRGTGLKGLTAIPEWNVTKSFILRPLMQVRRREIIEFAKLNQLNWVEDSSNNSSKYTRNFFRKELIPSIKKVYPQAEENLLDNIERFKKTYALYNLLASDLKEKICVRTGNEVRIPVRKLMKYRDTSLIYEIISDFEFGEKQVEEVMKLMDAGSGKYIENEMYRIIRHRNWLIIVPKFDASVRTTVIDEGETNVQFGGGVLEIQKVSKEKFQLQKNERIAQLDAKRIEYPLILRKWKQGDYFYPLGMRKKKKLSRFFIDQKLSKNKKEDIWVLESDKKIVWVLGMRIDDRFKVTENTKEILRISLTIP